jgi:hypothetical protein
MADQTKHIAVVSFEVMVTEVIQLTVGDETTPDTYRCTISHLNSNQQGALSPVLVGYGIEDFAGSVYEMIATTSTTIDVVDIFRYGYGMVTNRIAIVFKPTKNSPFVAPNRYDQLDKSALDRHREKELDFLVKKLYWEKYKLPVEDNTFGALVEYAVALGQGNTLEGNKSFAIGEGHITKSFVETIVGLFALESTGESVDSWIATDHLFTIGNGTADGSRSNAVEVFKSGLVKLHNSLLIGEYSHAAVAPVNGMLQYSSGKLELRENDEWRLILTDAPSDDAVYGRLNGEWAEVNDSLPATITSTSINEDNGLTHTHELEYLPIEDLGFEIRDITAGTAESFTLDIKATFAHTIESIDLETDNGTLTGVSVLINATPVTGMSSITVDTAVDTTLGTAAKTVAIGDRVYLSLSTGYTGTPTLIRGKLTTKRL